MSPRLRPCLVSGCSAFVTHGTRCPAHALDREHQRGTTAERGYNARHRRWRLMVLTRHPLCVDCGKPATDADHIIPLSRGGSWALENGAGRCHSCHSRRTARQQNTPDRVVGNLGPQGDDRVAADLSRPRCASPVFRAPISDTGDVDRSAT